MPRLRIDKTDILLMTVVALCSFPGIAAACEGAGEETPAWQVCTNLEAKIGSYSNAKCTQEKAEGEYDWVEVTEAKKVVEKGTLTVKAKLPSSVEFEAKCSTSGEGTIGSGNKGEITKDTLEKCTSGADCETLESIKTINLPWETELFSENEETIREKIKNGHTIASEEPGWDMVCKYSGELWTVECTSATTSTLIEDVTSSGLVDSAFDTKSSKPYCRAGVKEGEGTVTGTTEIEVSGGKGLQARPGVVYRIGGKTIDFEQVKEKTAKKEKIILRNKGTVTYTSVRIQGFNPAGNTAFTKGETDCDGEVKGTKADPGECEIKVTFTPPGAKTYAAWLRVGYGYLGLAAHFIPTLTGEGTK